MLTVHSANEILSKYSKDAVNLVREFRLQSSNIEFLEFDKNDNLVPINNPWELQYLKGGYDQGGYSDGVFDSGDPQEFEHILEALEIVEPDPSVYRLPNDRWEITVEDLDCFELARLAREVK